MSRSTLALMRYLPLFALISLSACSSAPWLTGQTDSHCVREQMFTGTQGNPLPFSHAMQVCEVAAQQSNDGHPRPLDLRDDATLQAMAENPDYNTASASFVHREAKTKVPGGVRRVNID
ncbi:hypothetical protein [Gluconobacter cerinus]|uniref:hypothetical protein n=1 Tax=Gluconobacter cerinus TaxID=38307 RepID=UPI003AB7C4BC